MLFNVNKKYIYIDPLAFWTFSKVLWYWLNLCLDYSSSYLTYLVLKNITFTYGAILEWYHWRNHMNKIGCAHRRFKLSPKVMVRGYAKKGLHEMLNSAVYIYTFSQLFVYIFWKLNKYMCHLAEISLIMLYLKGICCNLQLIYFN